MSKISICTNYVQIGCGYRLFSGPHCWTWHIFIRFYGTCHAYFFAVLYTNPPCCCKRNPAMCMHARFCFGYFVVCYTSYKLPAALITTTQWSQQQYLLIPQYYLLTIIFDYYSIIWGNYCLCFHSIKGKDGNATGIALAAHQESQSGYRSH